MRRPPNSPLIPSCLACGYLLRGLPDDGRCPECGVDVAISLREGAPLVIKPQEARLLGEPTPCVRCGRMLEAALSVHEPCPGCASPVWFSIYGDWLRAADPRWLMRVRSGIAIWLGTIAAGVAATLLLMVVGAVVGMSLGAAPGLAPTSSVNFVSILSNTAWAIVRGLLTFLIVSRVVGREPSESPHSQRARSRRMLYAAAAVNLLGAVGLAIAMVLERGPWEIAAVSSLTMAGSLCIAGLIGSLRDLANRIPNRRLARTCTVVIWGYLLGSVPMSVIGLAMTPLIDLYDHGNPTAGGSTVETTGGEPSPVPDVAPSTPAAPAPGRPSPALVGLGLGVCFFGLVTTVFVLWLAVLLFQMRSALGFALHQVLTDTGHTDWAAA